MLILACVLVAVLAVPLTGGRLRQLAGLRWRAPWLVVGALLAQVLVLEVSGLPAGLAAAAHVATYALAGWFVWLNRAVRGIGVLALGAAANGVTIVLNGGTLPSSASARAAAGLDPVDGFTNSGVVADPVLGFLGDNFAVPAPFPVANVFSIGDVLIVLGVVLVLFSLTRRPSGGSSSDDDRAPDAAPDTAPGADVGPGTALGTSAAPGTDVATDADPAAVTCTVVLGRAGGTGDRVKSLGHACEPGVRRLFPGSDA